MKKILFTFFILFSITGCAQQTAPAMLLNGHRINLELATTPERQTLGLSGHAPLADDQGMLFIFDQKTVQSFWMKDMLFPLDIIWLDQDKIVKISKNLPAEGHQPKNIYRSDLPVDRVLEITAGLSNNLNLKVGDKVTYEF